MVSTSLLFIVPASRFPRKLAPDRFSKKILEMILTYSWFPDPSLRFVQTIFVAYIIKSTPFLSVDRSHFCVDFKIVRIIFPSLRERG